MEAKPNFKEMSLKKKIGYVWDYYRLHIGIVLVLAIIIISLIHHYATLKESVLDLLFLNATNTYENPAGFDEFLTEQGFDMDKQTITLTTSLSFPLEEGSFQSDYYSTQALAAMFAAGDLDVFAAPKQIYNDFASAGYVADLRFLFTEEELAPYQDILIYTTDAETGEPFPSAFDLTGNRWLSKYAYYSDGYYLAVTANTDTPELTKEFFFYVLNY